ncbi:hypothetical protein E2320_017995 [Naja naja]|nr:hypothetical protein E2320_017995 [Naja naja]
MTCSPPSSLLTGTEAAGPGTASDPSQDGTTYPEGVSFQGAHHGQEKGLLQEGKKGTDERLQPGQAAKLRGGIPGRLGIRQVTPKPTSSTLVKAKARVALQIFWIWRSRGLFSFFSPLQAGGRVTWAASPRAPWAKGGSFLARCQPVTLSLLALATSASRDKQGLPMTTLRFLAQ